MNISSEQRVSPGTGRFAIALIAFLAIGAFFLLAEHRTHLLGFLLYVLLLACPLMHFFMHGRHGHGHAANDDRPGPTAGPNT